MGKKLNYFKTHNVKLYNYLATFKQWYMDNVHAQLRLKKKVLIQCGISQLREQDCKVISQLVFLKNKNYISESSIKRLYGFWGKETKFVSRFILDSLSQFIGFENWEAFKSSEVN